MIWVVVLAIWITISMPVVGAHIEKIENLPTEGKRVISYIVFAAGGPLIFLAGLVIDVLERLGIEFDDGNGDLW